jgi:hypothetical protein
MVNASSDRLHALDAARATALLLGIVLPRDDVLLATKGADGCRHGQPPQPLPRGTISRLAYVPNGDFFLLAGFFGHMSLHKKGLRAFVADRLKRIGIPLVVGWPILFGAIVAVTIWGADVISHGGPPQLPSAFPELPAFPLTHLWFLYVLLWLYAATLLLMGSSSWWIVTGACAPGSTASRAGWSRIGWVTLHSPYRWLTLYFTPPWLAWFGQRCREREVQGPAPLPYVEQVHLPVNQPTEGEGREERGDRTGIRNQRHIGRIDDGGELRNHRCGASGDEGVAGCRDRALCRLLHAVGVDMEFRVDRSVPHSCRSTTWHAATSPMRLTGFTSCTWRWLWPCRYRCRNWPGRGGSSSR